MNYERGENLQKLAVYYNEDGKAFIIGKYLNFKNNYIEYIKKFIGEKNWSPSQLAKYCEVHRNTVMNGINGKNAPLYEIWDKYFKEK